MPWFGLGVFKVENGNEATESVKAAIKNGYRSIDTAAIYKNEEGVGIGIKNPVWQEKSSSSHQKCGMKIKATKQRLLPLKKA